MRRLGSNVRHAKHRTCGICPGTARALGVSPMNRRSQMHQLLHGLVVGSATALVTVAASPASAALRCPSDMALVGRSCVDKYEASLAEITSDGREVPFSPYEPPTGHVVKAVSAAGVTPQAHISFTESQKACSEAGKRLCEADEWIKACRGPEGTTYPYGNEAIAHACVDTDRTSPIQMLKQGVFDHTTMNDPVLNQTPNTVAPTGAAASCTNAYGVRDQVGNVHEWAADGAFHGGYYLDTKDNGEGCSYKTTAHDSTYYDYSTGFRCCADATEAPEEAPSTKERSLEGSASPSPLAWYEASLAQGTPELESDTGSGRALGTARAIERAVPSSMDEPSPRRAPRRQRGWTPGAADTGSRRSLLPPA
jgi:formylglycine-generating enzyme